MARQCRFDVVGRFDAKRSAARLLRSVPLVGMEAAAALGRGDSDQLRRALQATPARSRCAQRLLEGVAGSEAAMLASVAHPACPPTGVRLAVDRCTPSGGAGPASPAAAGQGSPPPALQRSSGWLSRRDMSAGIPRSSHPAALARSEVAAAVRRKRRDARRVLALRGSACPPAAIIWVTGQHAGSLYEAAQQPECPATSLAQAAARPQEWVRAGAAAHTRCPPALVHILAGDLNQQVRCSVAENSGSPARVLLRLAADDSHSVRLGVAGNQSSPPEALTRLCADKSRHVREAVASNSATAAHTLHSLAEGDDAEVRRCIAQNSSCPARVLRRLMSDTHPEVRRAAADASERRQ